MKKELKQVNILKGKENRDYKNKKFIKYVKLVYLINNKVKGFNYIKSHKILATIHFSSMVATNYYKDKNKDNHKAAAYTAFASYATAVLVIKF